MRDGFFLGTGVALVLLVDVEAVGCGLFKEGVREMGRGGLNAGRECVDLGGMFACEDG